MGRKFHNLYFYIGISGILMKYRILTGTNNDDEHEMEIWRYTGSAGRSAALKLVRNWGV